MTATPTRRRKTNGCSCGYSFASLLDEAACSLFATVFPSSCRLCGFPLNQISRVPVCLACLDSVRTMDNRVCQVCGRELLQPDLPGEFAEAARCPSCVHIEPEFRRAAAYGGYDGVLCELIHLLKYDRVRPVAGVLGRMLARVVSDVLAPEQPERVLVVPVPLHARKLRQRGFNQSELIARQALKSCSSIALQLDSSVLVRTRFTETQTGLSREQRQANIHGAFRVEHPTNVAGRSILLVDDVLTTGTTVGESARVLKRAGADSVWVATVARVLRAESSVPAWAEGKERDQNLAMGSATGRA